MTSSARLGGARRAAFAAQALVVLGLPFVRVGGESALRLDVPSLTLFAFGAAIQVDELFLVLAATLAATFLFALVTVVWGRAWCGWGCPQTFFSQLVEWPRRPAARLALAAGVAALGAWSVVAYFVPPAELARRALAGAPGPVVGGAFAVLALILFLDLALVRHRFCATVCPYAKLQGVLFDRHTLAVAYDARRGAECIDCRACVRACPTGIDIRDGLQAACIACAECADACGPILARLGRANLVGYAWGEPGAPRRLVRPASVALAALAAASLAVLAAALAGRGALDLSASAAPGFSPRTAPDGRALNAFEVALTNRGRAPLDVALALTVGAAPATVQPDRVRLRPGEHRTVRVLAAAAPGAGPAVAELSATAGDLRMTRALTFVPPDPGRSR